MSTEYIGVRTVFFNKFDKLPFDIFLKLTTDKYVKALNVGDHINDEFIKKYVSKKVFEFFLEKKAFTKYEDLIFDFHSNAKVLLVEGRKIKVPDNENLNLMIEDLGVSKKEIKKINEMSTRIMIDLNNTHNNITKLLDNFTSSKESFTYDHSYLTAIMSCQIAGINEWGINHNKEKLCLAAILHELSDSNQYQKTLKYQVAEQDLTNGISPQLLENVKILSGHLRELDSIPIDVISILENSLNFTQATLSPLICCFIVGHQYVLELYKAGFNNSHNNDILERLNTIFPNDNLNKQVKNLKHALEN
ncbi:MAG: hypothetical protein HN576_03770 [Bacteriovoracaceae bacterium]|nr:hypothetical protein [Bacteriovoracaceae bacterium]